LLNGSKRTARARAASSFPTPPRKSRREAKSWLWVPARVESGKINPPDVELGDIVLFGKWSGAEVKIDGADLLIMKESDILGVIESSSKIKAAA
jgi:Chaperonin 10 Kd subunit